VTNRPGTAPYWGERASERARPSRSGGLPVGLDFLALWNSRLDLHCSNAAHLRPAVWQCAYQDKTTSFHAAGKLCCSCLLEHVVL